ncbi:hypothetical protein Taro_047122 [Colocasia esculenta]|uniref:Uncharacterized protein n=1 Tax=Colocasia esculenta TaxID=4460 RepID=A0A843X517_COLES|nr:hypothetical protein [Colocasia esculenta]
MTTGFTCFFPYLWLRLHLLQIVFLGEFNARTGFVLFKSGEPLAVDRNLFSRTLKSSLYAAVDRPKACCRQMHTELKIQFWKPAPVDIKFLSVNRTEWESFHLRRPRVRLPVYVGRPGDRDHLPVHAGHPDDRDRLPVHAGDPGDRDRLPDPANSVTFPIPITIRGKIDPSSASRYITTLVHAHIPRLVDSWKEFPPSVQELLFDMFTRRYVFTRPEDLPRARVVWESTTQTNLRKSMWEARDKATKTTCSLDPTAWMDYGPIWLRRDYWESLCHRWATGPWQERSQAAKRNRATHPEKNLHTSGSKSYATHSKKLETYDRTMADRDAEGTPHPDLDPEAWVDAAGGSIQCCPHTRVRSLLRPTRIHLLHCPAVVERT